MYNAQQCGQVVVVALIIMTLNQCCSSRSFDHRDHPQAPRPGDYTITVAANASSEERYAAAQLQHWLQRGCSCVIDIQADTNSSALATPHQLAVGSGAAQSSGLLPDGVNELASLGLEGFVLLSDIQSFSVAITGAPGAPRGTIYGVYEYLERLGFGFWASDATTVPAHVHQLYIPGLKERQLPALSDWRHNNNANLELQQHAAFSIAARQNNNGGAEVYTSRDVQKVGGGVRWYASPKVSHCFC